MSFEIRPIIHTSISADAFINSLGVAVTTPGAICKSIRDNIYLHEDKCKFDDEINKLKDENHRPGDVVIDPHRYGFKGLKAIINIFTPYYKYDPKLIGLAYTCAKALIKAKETNNIRRISFAVLGTGANGYPRALVTNLLVDLIGAFCDIYPYMTVTLCVPVKEGEDANKKISEIQIKKSLSSYLDDHSNIELYPFEFNSDYFEHLEDSKPLQFLIAKDEEYDDTTRIRQERALYLKEHDYSEYLDEINALFTTDVKRPIKIDDSKLTQRNIYSYLEEYKRKRFPYISDKSKKILNKYLISYLSKYEGTAITYKNRYDFKEPDDVKKIVYLQYIYAFRMDLKEAEDFLRFGGYTFSNSESDRAHVRLINDYIYDKDEIDSYLKGKHLNSIF